LKKFADSFWSRFGRGRTAALAALAHLCAWCALVSGCLASPGAFAADLVFNGGAAGNCSLSGTSYTCNGFPLTTNTDRMTIADGYTVIVNSSGVNFDYNQSLAMSGSATLSVSGNLNIGNIKPSNLAITGGNLISGGTFTIGAQAQSITANISAVTMNLGSGSTLSITGNVTASGNISIGSHATISGAVSGNVIDTDSPSIIKGNVTARTSFTLASGSSVTGNIVAPTVSLLASQSTVNGKITASTSLRLGDKVNVTGDVSTGNLTLDSSNAIINGNATVDRATLNWAGRVTKMIYCTGGTTNGQCDCVTNNSGFPVNTDQGPHCAVAPAATPIDHFLIVHDGSASACTPEPVTVKACANAGCTSYYTGGVTVNLQPGGGSVAIGSSGVSANATVSQSTPGTATLALSGPSVAVANPLQCSNTANGSASCNMNFDGSIGLGLSLNDHYSATVTRFTLTATVSDAKTKSCMPALAGQQKTIQLSCSYADPASGSLPFKVSSVANVALGNDPSFQNLCTGSARTYPITFDNNGSATFSMYYADVGKLAIAASTLDNSAQGTSGNVIVAPSAFSLKTTSPTIAGKPFDATAVPLNNEGVATPNFGRESTPERVNFSMGALDTTGCKLTPADLGQLSLVDGKITAAGFWGQFTYTEAGAFNIQAEQASTNYLGGAKPRPAAVQTSLGAASGCGAIVSVPAYFKVQESRVGANKPNFYYSGEPVDVTVTAMSALGNVTTLYDTGFGYSKPVVLTAYDASGTTPIPATSTTAAPFPNPGTLSGLGSSSAAPLPASAFVKGVASLSTSSVAPLTFKFANSPSLPLKVRLRAAETAAGGVSSKDAPAGGEDIYEARSGRVTIASRFGSAKGDLALPVTLQYWTGGSWIQNLDDSDTLHPIPTSAIAIQAAAPLLPPTLSAAGIDQGRQVISMAKGLGSLSLHPAGGTGTATVAINLGAATTDTSCLPAPRPASTGAKMPWLRGPNGICAGTAAASADPAARATFGVYTPEARRLIHTREVFN
jgi:MSHA biogenesis protein MshQ